MRFLEFIRQQGYRPYHGTVTAAVYADLHCETPAKARWFHRPGSFQCAGCAQQCETDSSDGFQHFLLTDQSDD